MKLVHVIPSLPRRLETKVDQVPKYIGNIYSLGRLTALAGKHDANHLSSSRHLRVAYVVRSPFEMSQSLEAFCILKAAIFEAVGHGVQSYYQRDCPVLGAFCNKVDQQRYPDRYRGCLSMDCSWHMNTIGRNNLEWPE